jgi:hypothetical protein
MTLSSQLASAGLWRWLQGIGLAVDDEETDRKQQAGPFINREEGRCPCWQRFQVVGLAPELWAFLQFHNEILEQVLPAGAYLIKLNSHAGFARTSYRPGQAQSHPIDANHDFDIAWSGKWPVRLNVAAVLAEVFQLALALSR